ncbi:hypothetical protein J5283_26515 [Rhizobium sp. 16-488-2a]|nr:hypothetical protein [Rhizobium sp. 16-488-2b]MBO9177729.1 hypothetical protein [Rhizobium sp. 16-488-2a]
MPGVFNWTIKRLPSLPNDLLIRSNSFDQWSAELGRELANGLLPVIEGTESTASHDSATQGLVAELAGLKGIRFIRRPNEKPRICIGHVLRTLPFELFGRVATASWSLPLSHISQRPRRCVGRRCLVPLDRRG